MNTPPLNQRPRARDCGLAIGTLPPGPHNALTDVAGVLIQAHIAHAAILVITAPDSMQVRQIAQIARTLNPDIEIVLRTHSEGESQLLRQDGIGTVFFGEEELAKGMVDHVLQQIAP